MFPVLSSILLPAATTARGARPAVVLGTIVAGVLVAGCAGPVDSGARPGAASPVAEHVHGLGLDPTDGTVYVATHDGLFAAAAGEELAPVGTAGRDLMGFTMAGPGTILSSGHPGPGEDAANPLGLVRSTDGGASYTTLSLAGEVDFHALDVSSGTVYGLDAGRQTLRASSDGGTTWQDRATLAALDIAVDPADVASVLATVQGGVAASRDGGRHLRRTHRARHGLPLLGTRRHGLRHRARRRPAHQHRRRHDLAAGRNRPGRATAGRHRPGRRPGTGRHRRRCVRLA